MHLTFYFLIFFLMTEKLTLISVAILILQTCSFIYIPGMSYLTYSVNFRQFFPPVFFLCFFKDHSIGLNWTIYGILWIKVLIIKNYFPVVIIINWIKFRYDRNSATSSCHRYNYRENENSGEIIIWVYQI